MENLSYSLVHCRAIPLTHHNEGSEADLADSFSDLDIEHVIVSLFHPESMQRVHEHLQNKRNKCDLWARVWGTSHLLADMLISRPIKSLLCTSTSFRPKILEIGAGTGLSSLSVITGGCKWDCTITDGSEEAVEIIQQSLQVMNPNDSCVDSEAFLHRAQTLSWFNVESITEFVREHGQSHLVLGSDVLFVSANVPAVAEMLSVCLHHCGIAAIIDPGRLSAEGFSDRLRERYEFDVVELVAHNLIFLSNACENTTSEAEAKTEIDVANEHPIALKLVRLYLIKRSDSFLEQNSSLDDTSSLNQTSVDQVEKEEMLLSRESLWNGFLDVWERLKQHRSAVIGESVSFAYTNNDICA